MTYRFNGPSQDGQFAHVLLDYRRHMSDIITAPQLQPESTFVSLQEVNTKFKRPHTRAKGITTVICVGGAVLTAPWSIPICVGLSAFSMLSGFSLWPDAKADLQN